MESSLSSPGNSALVIKKLESQRCQAVSLIISISWPANATHSHIISTGEARELRAQGRRIIRKH